MTEASFRRECARDLPGLRALFAPRPAPVTHLAIVCATGPMVSACGAANFDDDLSTDGQLVTCQEVPRFPLAGGGMSFYFLSKAPPFPATATSSHVAGIFRQPQRS